MQKRRRTLCFSGTNRLLISDFGSSTRGERHDSYYANNPQYLAHLVVQSQFLNIMVGPNFSNSWSDPNFKCLPQWQTTQLSAYMAQSQLPTDVIFKILNFSAHHFRAWRHSHSNPISYQGFIMTIVIVIFFARECKLYPMLCTRTKSRIVHSPTKLNDKI